MKRTFCDGCDKEIKNLSLEKTYTIKFKSNGAGYNNEKVCADVCNECMLKIAEILKRDIL